MEGPSEAVRGGPQVTVKATKSFFFDQELLAVLAQGDVLVELNPGAMDSLSLSKRTRAVSPAIIDEDVEDGPFEEL